MDIESKIRGHKGAINAVDFSVNAQELITGGRNGHIKRWQKDTSSFMGSLVRNRWSIHVTDTHF